jgi:hypothetical protein
VHFSREAQNSGACDALWLARHGGPVFCSGLFVDVEKSSSILETGAPEGGRCSAGDLGPVDWMLKSEMPVLVVGREVAGAGLQTEDINGRNRIAVGRPVAAICSKRV